MRSEKTYVSEANQNAPWVLERQDVPVSVRWKLEISGTRGNQRGKLAKKLVNVLCLHYYETK